MATYRIGIGSEFQIKDDAVGVGKSTTGLGNLRVDGVLKASNLSSAGVSTFTRYSGFSPDQISGNITLTGEHSTTGDIVVGTGETFTVSTGATITVGTVESVSIGTHFSPPTGGIEDRPEAPVEGMVRFNIDLSTLEFYNGFEWRQFTTNGARGRGIIAGGFEPGIGHKRIQFFEAATLGNTQNFGELSFAHYSTGGGCGNEIRGVMGGSGPETNTMEYITIASQGDGIDFGDLFQGRGYAGGTASSTRGIIAGGYDHPTNVNTIDYVEIMTLGNAKDFGDLTNICTDPGACNTPVRSVFPGRGGPTAAIMEVIDFVITASKGEAVRFGNMVSASDSCTAHSNSTRAIIGTARGPVGAYGLELASEGNSYAFADLNINMREQCFNTGNMTRSVIGGGYTPGYTNSMEYITISTAGSAADFGDMMAAITAGSSFSDSHGGLGGY